MNKDETSADATPPNVTKTEVTESHGAGYWLAMIPPWGRVIVGFMFMFTIWSVFTGFDLGNILNKYADASLEQNKMQFEAQIQMQNMQFQATEHSNDKLDILIASVESVNDKIANQAKQIAALSNRMGTVEMTVGRLARWSCSHEGKDAPEYCVSLQPQPPMK